jgi:hypothetical protein
MDRWIKLARALPNHCATPRDSKNDAFRSTISSPPPCCMPSRLKLHYLHLRIYLFVHPSLAGIGSAGSCVDGKVRLDAEITPAVALGMAGRKPTTQHSAILEPQFWDLSLSASCVSRFSSRPQPSSRLVSAQ